MNKHPINVIIILSLSWLNTAEDTSKPTTQSPTGAPTTGFPTAPHGGGQTAQSCLTPYDDFPIVLPDDFCINFNFHGAEIGTPAYVDLTALYGGKSIGTERLNQDSQKFKPVCRKMQECNMCLGFSVNDIAENWAYMCPMAVLKCSILPEKKVPMPCVSLGDEQQNDSQDITIGITLFGFDLLQQIGRENKDDMFVAPFSMANTLLTTMLATKGATREQIRRVLHIRTEDTTDSEVAQTYGALVEDLRETDDDATCGISSNLWMNPNYMDDIAFDYKKECAHFLNIRKADFSANPSLITAQVNEEISTETHGHVTQAVPIQVGANTIMLFTNAIYFNAKWEYGFTKDTWEVFTDKKREHLRVDMMFTESVPLKVSKTDTLEFIEVPLKGDNSDFAFFVIRPVIETTGELLQVEELLSEKPVRVWMELAAKAKATEMVLALPIFEMFYIQDVTKDLQAMGIVDVMDPEKSDMSRLFAEGTSHNAYDDAFNRQGWLKVTEDGIEAAAFSGDGMGHEENRSGFIPHADRPFIFLVWDKGSNVLLFAGRITNPEGWRLTDGHSVSENHHSAFWIMFSLLILATLVYFLLRFTYNIAFNDLSGTEAIPHHECLQSSCSPVVGAIGGCYLACSDLIGGMMGRSGEESILQGQYRNLGADADGLHTDLL